MLYIYIERERERVGFVFFLKIAQLCPTLCDPVDCSLPGSSVHGIFQARVLERGAIAFSEALQQMTSFQEALD